MSSLHYTDPHPASLSNVVGKRHVKTLFETIVFSEVCSGCGVCVVTCPVGEAALSYQVDKPILLEKCIDCQLCYRACPRMEYQKEEIRQVAFPDAETVFDARYGPTVEIFGARATEDGTRRVGQDGGVVTALLGWMMDEGLIEGAVTSGRSSFNHWDPWARLATTKEELAACAGSTYTYSPNPLALRDALKRKLKRVAFVGVGCEVSGVRKLEVQKSRQSRKYVENVVVNIGLLCSESFTFKEFVEGRIVRGLGVRLEDVVKVNIKGKVLVYMRDGTVHSLSLKQCKTNARVGCHYCQDFGAEEADISCGGLGLDGWTVTFVRTKRGKELMDRAVEAGVIERRPAEEFQKSLDLYVRLAGEQRKRPLRPAGAESVTVEVAVTA